MIFTILFWNLFLEGCVSLLHLVVLLGIYFVASSETKSYAFSFWLASCDYDFLSGGCGITVLLASSVFPLVDEAKRLCKLPNGREWQLRDLFESWWEIHREFCQKSKGNSAHKEGGCWFNREKWPAFPKSALVCEGRNNKCCQKSFNSYKDD